MDQSLHAGLYSDLGDSRARLFYCGVTALIVFSDYMDAAIVVYGLFVDRHTSIRLGFMIALRRARTKPVANYIFILIDDTALMDVKS